MRKVICLTVATVIAVQTAPCMAGQPGNRSNFARIGTDKTDFPPSTGRFAPRSTERSGPVDLATNSSITAPAPWRTCQQCGYDGEDPKPFKAVGLRASFQPIGGTFSYRF